MAQAKTRYNQQTGEMEEIWKQMLFPGTDIYVQAQQMDDGSWSYSDPSSRMLADGSSYYYDPQRTEAQGDGITGGGAGGVTGPYNTLQQSLFSGALGDLPAFRPGTVLSQEEVAQMLPLLMNPDYIKGAPTSAEEYFGDPRAAIKIENGQFVWRPDQMQGDWESSIGGNYGLDTLKGFISSPGVQVMASALGGGGLSSFLNVAGQAASTATDNPIYKQLTGLLNLANGVYNNWDSISNFAQDPIGNLSKLNPFGGDGAVTGGYTDTYSPGTFSNAMTDAGTFSPMSSLEDMTSAITSGATPAVSTGGVGDFALTDSGLGAALGLPAGGLAAILGGTGMTIPGTLGNIALDAAGNQINTGVNLGNSAQTAVPGLGSDVGSSGAGAATASSAASELLKKLGLDVSPGMLDLIGKGLGAGIGLLGSNAQSDALQKLYNDTTAQRAPFLNKAVGYLNNPDSFYTSPEATGAANATMRALSTKFGNPGTSPTAQSLATGALYDRYSNAVNSLGSLGLSGQGIQANLGSQIASMSGQPYAIGGNLIGSMTSPSMGMDKQLADTFRRMFSLS